MADLKLKKVVMRNWMKFKGVDLAFPDHGIVMVTGINTASGGALQSVGSGKTGFGEAISRTLFGVQGRFVHLRQFSGDKRGNTYVRVEADFLGKPLTVETGYQCKELNPKSEALRFTYDGKQIERGTIAQTREELVKLLNVSPLLAGWTVFVDGEKMKFNLLSQADSVDLVMSSLKQPPWTQFHDRAKTVMGKFRLTMAQEETTHQQAHSRKNEAQQAYDDAVERLTEAKRDYDEAVAHHQSQLDSFKAQISTLTESVATHRKEQAQIAAEMKKLEDEKAAKHHQLEIRQRDVDERLRVLKTKTKPLLEATRLGDATLTEKTLAYTNYRDAKRVCPTCKRPMGDKLDESHLAELKHAYEAAVTARNAAHGGYDAHTSLIESAEEEQRKLVTAIEQLGVKFGITKLSQRHESLGEQIDDGLASIHRLELQMAGARAPSDSALNVATSAVNDRLKALEKAKTALTAAAEALTVSQATLKVMDYWNVAFSPYGIPNMVLREAIAPLNAEAQRISTTMTGGTIEVVYSTTRELASGMEKAQLNIEINNRLGSKDLTGSSKGESGLTNFIISETLSNVGQVSRRVGYRWYDEVVPHQDPKVCHAIYTYLSEIADKLGILIFMVDHNPVVANYADHFLVVEKKGPPDNVIGSVYWRH